MPLATWRGPAAAAQQQPRQPCRLPSKPHRFITFPCRCSFRSAFRGRLEARCAKGRDPCGGFCSSRSRRLVVCHITVPGAALPSLAQAACEVEWMGGAGASPLPVWSLGAFDTRRAWPTKKTTGETPVGCGKGLRPPHHAAAAAHETDRFSSPPRPAAALSL